MRMRFSSLRAGVQRRPYLFAALCVLLSTGLFLLGRDYFAKGQWALLYLLIIGLVAGLAGVRPALLAAFLAFFAWNYFFLPPFHTFVVADPKDWISLIAFLVVGIAVGLQTGRLRERETEAVAREREMVLLNRFSAYLVSETTLPDMADALIKEVERTGAVRCAMLLLPDEDSVLRCVGTACRECEPPPEVFAVAEWVGRNSKAVGLPVPPGVTDAEWPVSESFAAAGFDADRRDMFVPLQTASRFEGVLYVGERTDGQPFSYGEARLMVAVANQAAAFLEREHLHGIAVQAKALREADKLKSTLISSVSHELKTPLASATATVSNLLERDMAWDADDVRQELEAVQDDMHRLNNSISALLDLSRLESAAWEPQKQPYELGEILGIALSRISQKQRPRVSFEMPEDLPMIGVDFHQWSRVLQNLIENALAYSPPDSTVHVGASASESEVRMWVEDEGPGIPAEEKDRVFEKFYRGRAAATVPSGTGLGLAVTREIVRSHGGRIWVEDVSPHGARMAISLPREDEV